MPFSKNYYSFSQTKVSHSEAQRLASERSFAGVSGHLWVPNALLEFQELLATLQAEGWIDLSYDSGSGKWLFNSGPMAKTDLAGLLPWFSGVPIANPNDAKCVLAGRQPPAIYNLPCSTLFTYIVEFECPFGQRFNDQGTACIGFLELRACPPQRS
jgi:hypothetical protein